MTTLRQNKGRKPLALLLAIGLLAALLAGCNTAVPNLEVPGVTTAAPITDIPEPKPSAAVPTEQESSATGPVENEYGLTVLSWPHTALPSFYPGYELWVESINAYTGSITLSVPKDMFDSSAIRFEVTADGGSYYTLGDSTGIHGPGFNWYDAQFTVPDVTKLYWDCSVNAVTGEIVNGYPNFKEAYTRIVVYEGDHIVGYTVLRYERLLIEEADPKQAPEPPEFGEVVLYHRPVEDYGLHYRVVVVESVLFPKVDGQYQDVTREYVDQRLEDACIHWKSPL